MITIVCFKWGNKFSAEYVNKLYNAIKRNVTIPYEFICFTENPKGIECKTKPFLNDLPTWWYIIGLFNKDHGFKDKILYMDLDTVIMDNIDHILSLDTDFAITEDFYRPKGLQTTFIMWKPEWGYYIWDNLVKTLPFNSLEAFKGGTNRFIEQNTSNVDIFQTHFPKEFISYKVHVRDNKQPRRNKLPGDITTAKIVCFHGKPMPHNMRNLKWMKEHWI